MSMGGQVYPPGGVGEGRGVGVGGKKMCSGDLGEGGGVGWGGKKMLSGECKLLVLVKEMVGIESCMV